MDRAANGMQTAQRNSSENALREGKPVFFKFYYPQNGHCGITAL